MKMMRLILSALLIVSFYSNAILADTEVRGRVSGIWNTDGSPYVTTGNISISDRDTLAIEAGVEVHINQNHSFIIYGTIIAEGAPRDSIRFTYRSREGSGGLSFINSNDGTILDYCVVTGGRSAGGGGGLDTLSAGGNIFITGGDVTIRNTRISSGFARGYGGGVAVWRSQATFENCLISSNRSQEYAGGVGLLYSSSGNYINCQILDNSANIAGGGMCMWGTSHPTLVGCLFMRNGTEDSGGAINIYYRSDPSISHCTFISNTAEAGGAIYIRGNDTEPLIEWCWFDQNAANVGYRIGGAVYIREGAAPELRYNRFTRNNANRGGVFYFKDNPRANIHHNLFFGNSGTGEGENVGGGGVLATSDDVGDTPIQIRNCTFINNADIGIDPLSNTADLTGGARVEIISSILWDEEPYFNGEGRVTVTYSNVKHELEGEENSTEDPEFYGSDSTWFTISGNSPCIDSGDRDLPDDPDNTVNDRGWLHYPQNARESFEIDTLEAALFIDESETEAVMLRFTNDTGVPIYATPMDMWKQDNPQLLVGISATTGDYDINGALWTSEMFIIAGTFNGEANTIYRLNHDLAYQGDFEQPGNPGGDGFLDLATDGGDVLFGGCQNYIYEFTTDGEFGDRYLGPDAISDYNALGADNFNPHSFLDFYIAGDEGIIIRTDSDLWEQARIEVGEEVFSLGVKWNTRALYIVTMDEEDNFFLSLVIPDEELIVPLYLLHPPGENYVIGGIEVTQDWEEGYGSLVGIWRGREDDDDMLFVYNLYTAWLDIKPDEKLILPGKEAEWEITFVGNQLPTGEYESQFDFTVNGNGDGNQIYARIETTSFVDENNLLAPSEFRLDPVYPNPFNSKARFSFYLRQTSTYQLSLVDLTGRTVKFISSGTAGSGLHLRCLDAGLIPTGTYYLKLMTPGNRTVQPLTVIR